jgi:hypothetical protein
MSTCRVERAALLKILLHALKYPTTGVNGILLGEERAEAPAAGAPPGAAARRALLVVDAVPACHSFLALAPVLEAALCQADAHARAAGGGLRVVGYYQAAERLEDAALGAPGRRAADRIEAAFPGAVALALDGAALRALVDAVGDGGGAPPPLRLLVRERRPAGGGGWAPPGPGAALEALECPTAGVADLLAAYVGEGRHRRLADFEDHLEDLAADWLNPGLLD